MPAKVHFTDAYVKALKPPKDKPQHDYLERVTHGRSLILTVGAERKTWSVLFYVRSKPKRRKLGFFGYSTAAHPSLTCKQAQVAASAFDAQAALAPKLKVGSFKEVAELWFARHASKLRSRSELRRHLDTIIYPRWQERPINAIRRGEVNALLDGIEDQRSAKQADAILATIRAIMNWHASRDENYSSPIVPKMRRDKRTPDKRQRSRTLDDNEIRNVWRAATDLGGSFGGIVQLCLLTAQRKAKVATMKWADVDLDSGIWTIATEDGEKGNPGRLKLPQVALDIIAAQPRIVGNPHVFAAIRSRKVKHGHFHSWSQRKRQLDKLLPTMEPWVVHDLRRTARSLMSSIGIKTEVAERALGHVQQGILRVYNTYGYEPEVADALARLAAKIAHILDPGADVVSLRA